MGFFDSIFSAPPEMSQAFRTKLGFLLLDSIGRYIPFRTAGPYITGYLDRIDEEPISNRRWKALSDAMRRKVGRQELASASCEADECLTFVLRANEEEVILVIETSFDLLTRIPATSLQNERVDVRINRHEAVTQLNELFAEHCLPYQWISGKITSTSSERISIPATSCKEETKLTVKSPGENIQVGQSAGTEKISVHSFLVFCSIVAVSLFTFIVFSKGWLPMDTAAHLRFWAQLMIVAFAWLIVLAIWDRRHAREWILTGGVAVFVGFCQISSQAHPEKPLREAQSQSIIH